MPVSAPPEIGQFVNVRGRAYVVADVRRSAVAPDPLRAPGGQPQHLVTLASIEDDGMGEELQAIWEIEPGARAFEQMALPSPVDGFDEPHKIDSFLDAVRWGAIASANTQRLQSPFRAGITIEDYQLDPAARAIEMPRVSLLIADDVGLGKTIEAGLVALELILRHRVRRILVVCPSSLQIQWRDQMRDKFGLEFRIVDSELMRDLRRTRGIHVNPWTHFPRLITSLDFLKRDRSARLFRETLPSRGEPTYPRRYDLLIVDEAHNAAPSGGGKYAIDSQRTEAIRMAAPHFEHKLFLTATPHNGYVESFTALLELLDGQRFARGIRPDPRQLEAVMVRRLKSDLAKKWDGSARFPPRRLEPIEVSYIDEERRIHAVLQRYSKLRLERSGDAQDRTTHEFVLKLLKKKRLFSSPAAFRATLARHEESIRRPKSQASRPSRHGILLQIERSDEEYEDDAAYEEATLDAVEAVSAIAPDLTADEAQALHELRVWADAAVGTPDSKAAELLRWLQTTLRPGGTWNDTRVVIFTEYRATQRWLQDLLATAGLGGDRLMILFGGMEAESRERIKAAFQAHPSLSPVRILLATDAASEGIDLQRHCSRLIHYEIPWNPNRLEQRNGRIDRHGQSALEVLVYHFVGAGYQRRLRAGQGLPPGKLDGDLEFLARAALKVEQIREDLGKVGPVIASQVEEAMLGRRFGLDTTQAEREAQPVRSMLRLERRLRERVQEIYARLQESRRELHLTPDRVQAAVETALQLAGQLSLHPAEVPGVSRAFYLPHLTGSWASCLVGLEHPHTKQIRPVVFDSDAATNRDDVVLVHLNHPLVQRCLRLLRAEVWAGGDQAKLRRVTARLGRNGALETPAVIAHGRLVIVGADGRRLHEEVVAAGGALREGRFTRLASEQVDAALGGALDAAAPETLTQSFQNLWPAMATPLRQALETLVQARARALQRELDARSDKEAQDIRAVLTELADAIRTELGAPQPVQLALFSDTEREQLERNRQALEARLREIPGEIVKEEEAVRARFAVTQTRHFPIAVTFLVPERLARREWSA